MSRRTYTTNDYAVRTRARAAYARRMARRRAITVTLAGLIFVIGVNVILAGHDAAVEPALSKMVERQARDLDSRTRFTNYVIDESAR